MTYRWEPTTPLDRILENGFKRIDEAVEGVIRKHCPKAMGEWAILNNIAAKGALRSGAACEVLGYAADNFARMRQDQREHNYRMSLAAERAALAPRPDWAAPNTPLYPYPLHKDLV